jgi:hypothetical protein
MNITQINHSVEDDCVRCTFIGRDASGKLRRPVIEFDTSDLVAMVELANEFRARQRALAVKHTRRAEQITDTGLPG